MTVRLLGCKQQGVPCGRVGSCQGADRTAPRRPQGRRVLGGLVASEQRLGPWRQVALRPGLAPVSCPRGAVCPLCLCRKGSRGAHGSPRAAEAGSAPWKRAGDARDPRVTSNGDIARCTSGTC